MKNYTGLFLAIVISFLFLMSCKSEHQKESLTKVDDMLSKVDVLENKLNQPHVKDYQLLYDTIRNHNDFFLNLPEEFEETEENLEIIYRYGTVEKTFKWLHTNYLSVYRQELTTSKRQINDLKDDIINKSMSEEEIDKYLELEDSILEDIEFKIVDKLQFAEDNYESYRIYHPKVLKLMEEYDFEL